MTGDVTLAPLGREDFGRVSGWLSDPTINRWLVSEFRGQDVTEMLVAAMARSRRNRTFVVSMDSEPCGIVGFSDFDEVDRIANLWYVLGEKGLAGRGITTRAVRQALDLGFDELGLQSIHAWIMEDNEASRRVLEKCGFSQAGRLRRAVHVAGGTRDRIYFDVLRDERSG